MGFESTPMESFHEPRKSINLKQKAGVLSRIFFWWTFLVIRNGHRKTYEIEDMPPPLPQDRSEKLGSKLEKAWLKELESSKICRRKASLLKTIVRVFWKEFIRIALLHSFNEFFISISRQIFLGYFLIYLKDTKKDAALIHQLKIIGITLIFSYGLNNLLTNHFLARSYHLGCKIKIALSSLMFRKCLRLGNNAEGDASTGRILNLMSNDLAKFDDIIMYCNYAYSGLISTIIISAIICAKVNLFATIVCLVCVFLPTPAQIFISKTMAGFRARIANASDERIRTMDEIICGIQIIKMYTWEKPYEKFLMYKRSVEMKLIRKALYLRGARIAINVIVSKFSLYTIVVVYSLSGGKIVPEVVFVVLGYCSIISKVMSGMFFRSLGECSECLVSTKRIQNFMELNEFKRPLINTKSEEKNAVEFRNVRCSWHLDSNRDTLKNITFNIEAKKFVTVIGQVGSGKSSLLNAILGELPLKEGSLKLNGSVSYYSQTPWIFAGTIRRNIIFYDNYDAEKYQKVVEACALKPDFALFPNADLTLIGERGITLSGGQKARVALARTLYKTADIYLLDDPLSAVDTRVSKQIFQRCILDLLKDKTCILVSHQLQFLMHSDYVILLNEGEIKHQGTFHQLMESDSTYTDVFKKSQNSESENFKSQRSDENDDANVGEQHHVTKDAAAAARTPATASQRTSSEMEKEENEITDPYALLRFLKRGAGIGGLILISCLFVSTQVLVSSCDVWLAYWTSAETNTLNGGDEKIEANEKWHYFSFEMSRNEYFIVGYSTILFGVIIAACLRNYTFAYYGQKCSKKIHKDAFQSVVRTNSSFFHNNPSGRILNRFSKDMGAVDEILIPFLLEATASFMQVLAAFAVSASISVAYIVPAVIIFALLIVVRNYYLRVSVNLKRVESIAKSPVFVHVHSTLQGLPIIRACSVAANKVICEFDRQQDVYSSAWYLYNMTALGYAYCLEVICFVYLAVIVVGSFFLNLSGSQIGLALAQLTLLLNFVQWSMKLSAEVSNQVTSVDRLLRYSDLESEKQPLEDSVSEDWPSKGKIIFNNVSFRYNISSQPAIRNISFVVESEQNIGIVGRTGAGKTSLLAVLFRLGYVDGSIIIDDVDTSFVRLEKLRSKISAIPQDPVLFSGTLRTNLDPFEEYTDDTLWKAIEDAQLKKVVTETNGRMGLDTLITEGGKNFSVGQRQLVCLARAIIRNNKILILDEATASVDQQTDSIIRKTIRDKLKSRTVLTIAHRLNTVVDCDKIMVMDRGSVVEYGHPYLLLRNRDGFFYKLVSETGDFVAAALTGIAKENYLFREQLKNTYVSPS